MIFTLGSINADHFYHLPRLPGPGETIAATSRSTGLGGKGANQSVAARLAGAEVCHVGAVGPDGQALIDRLAGFGVGTRHIRQTDTPTAHAIVMIDAAGENQIVIHPGANHAQDEAAIAVALAGAKEGDWLLLQNETSHQAEAAALAHEKGLNVAYSAAPFEAGAVSAVLPYLTVLILNAVEAAQLTGDLETSPEDLPVANVLVTDGARGATWIAPERGEPVHVPAFRVTPVDTTGAGDCFAGYAVAGLSMGEEPPDAMRRAAAAAAIAVTRAGTAEAIPSRQEVEAFLA